MTNLKKLIYGAVLAVSSVMPGPLWASDDIIDVNVPFSFVAAGRQMPAGPYVIETSKSSGIVLLRGSGRGVLIASGPGGSLHTDGKPGLVFKKKGESAYLIGIQTGDLPARSIPVHSFNSLVR